MHLKNAETIIQINNFMLFLSLSLFLSHTRSMEETREAEENHRRVTVVKRYV